MQRANHSLRGASCFSGAKVLLKLAVTFFFTRNICGTIEYARSKAIWGTCQQVARGKKKDLELEIIWCLCNVRNAHVHQPGLQYCNAARKVHFSMSQKCVIDVKL